MLQAEAVGKVAGLVDNDATLAAISKSLVGVLEQLTLANGLANQRAVSAAAAAAVPTSSGPQPITYSSVIFKGAQGKGGSCGKDKAAACDAVYHAHDKGANEELCSFLVRTHEGGYYDQEDVYECKYTLSTTNGVVTTPAVLKGSGSTGRVACHPPIQDPDDTSTAAWSATVGLLGGGLAVPR